MIDRRAGGLVAILLPWLGLAVAPGLALPFSTPKAWGLGVAAGVGLAILLFRGDASRRRADGAGAPRLVVALVLAWIACAALATVTGGAARPEALLRILAASILLLALLAAPPDPRRVLGVASATGVAVAAMVLLQAAGWDPFAAFGLTPAVAGARMRLYGTLGNPDFVAGFLAATACATAGRLALIEAGDPRRARRRALAALALGVELVALARLGSLATLLSILGAGAVVALAGGRRARRLALCLGAVALVAVAVGARHRAPAHTVDGRLYLWSVAAPHLAGAPWLGHGPGAFAALWPGWEARRWRVDPDAADRPFAGPERHAHNDWIEAGVDTGLLGLLALAGLLATALFRGLRYGRVEPARLAAAAGLASLVARSLVDFPLERPAELGLAFVLAAVAAAPFPLRREEHVPCTEAPVPSPPSPASLAAPRPGPRPSPVASSS